MKFRLLQLLVCPCCKGPLRLTVGRLQPADAPPWAPARPCSPCALGLYDPAAAGNCRTCAGLEIAEGMLSCRCGAAYPIRSCVPVLLPGQPAARHDDRTRKRFGYEWLRYPACFHEEERGIFFEETQLQPECFAGRLVLDAGCGMGRFTRAAGACSGEVVGVDLSESVHRAFELTASMPHVHILQADLLRLPLREEAFDIAYSLGVLHHTPATRAAFQAVARTVKQGGTLSVWVYGTAGKYAEFATNPLRPERSRYVRSPLARRAYWLLVLLREKISNALRCATVRLPHRLLYRLCYVPALLGALPLVRYLTFSAHPDWRVRLLENFDWLAPPFQYHHTKEEVAGWFRQEGFQPAGMLRHGFIPKVGITGTKQPDADAAAGRALKADAHGG